MQCEAPMQRIKVHAQQMYLTGALRTFSAQWAGFVPFYFLKILLKATSKGREY